MVRRFLFYLASTVACLGCGEGAATPDAKTPAPLHSAAPTPQALPQTAPMPVASAAPGTDAPEASKAATQAAPGATTPPTIEGLIKFVLGIQGRLGKLSELKKTLGLEFPYNARRASSEIQIKDGTQEATIRLLLEPAPQIVVGAWGRSEPDQNFDPRVIMMRILSKADIAPPVSRADKEILPTPPDNREVWAWGRFFYYYPKQNAEWILEWQKDRDNFHFSPADITKIRDVFVGVAKAMGKPGLSFSGYFAKNHAAAAVQGTSDQFDFRSAEMFVEEKTMDVKFLNETEISGFFKALGIKKITFAFKTDVGHSPVPVQVKGCDVTVTGGTWPDEEKRSGPDREGPTATFRVKSMSIDCGG